MLLYVLTDRLRNLRPQLLPVELQLLRNVLDRRLPTALAHVMGKAHDLPSLQKLCSSRFGWPPSVNFHILRHTHGSHLAMSGVPMGVVAAQLGHADTRMTEKHYAHLAPSYVAQAIRANFPVLGLTGGAAVIPLRRAKKA